MSDANHTFHFAPEALPGGEDGRHRGKKEGVVQMLVLLLLGIGVLSPLVITKNVPQRCSAAFCFANGSPAEIIATIGDRSIETHDGVLIYPPEWGGKLATIYVLAEDRLSTQRLPDGADGTTVVTLVNEFFHYPTENHTTEVRESTY